jgi:hypothetical protein
MSTRGRPSRWDKSSNGGATADAVAEVLDAIVRRSGPVMGDPDDERDRRAAREIVEWYSRTAVS